MTKASKSYKRRNSLDRRDSTGRGHETEKKLGAGKGNWGTLGEEAPLGDSFDQEADATPENPAATKTMTLDEWEGLQASSPRAGTV